MQALPLPWWANSVTPSLERGGHRRKYLAERPRKASVMTRPERPAHELGNRRGDTAELATGAEIEDRKRGRARCQSHVDGQGAPRPTRNMRLRL
jgi:hypothetical protein